jgi:hypothetical protein
MPKQRIDSAEGRAIAARPSLRLLTGLLALVATALVAAPVASAAPVKPVLSGTTPQSPGIDLEPFVRGSSTGIITTGIPMLRSGAVTAAPGDRTIEVYASESCEGTPVASGPAVEFDASGLQVSVEPETITHLSALQREEGEAEPSECSDSISYEHVTELPEEPEEEPPAEEPPAEEPPAGQPPATPPPAQPPVQNDPIDGKAPVAPQLHTVPGGWANHNFPKVTGKAPGAASVKIYADAACQGPVVGRGSAAELAAGLPIQVADNVVAVFSGVSVANGRASSCSAPVYYVEDSLAPRTRITFGPAFKTKRRKVVFRFTDTRGSAPGTVFRCKLDRRRWKRCKSPLRLKRLSRKRHQLRIKAIDPAGNRERKPVKRRFKVIRPR